MRKREKERLIGRERECRREGERLEERRISLSFPLRGHTHTYGRGEIKKKKREGRGEGGRRGGENFLPLTHTCTRVQGEEREESYVVTEISVARERERERKK